jgi:hypothetical protein
MKVRVLKLKSMNSKMSGSQRFHVSLTIPITTLCIVMFVERLVKSNLSLEKSLNVKVLFIIIKLKVWNMKIVSMWYQKKPILQISIFCLIQGINNYVQINTYWRYIVRIMASNILLLASKKCFLTSQGLVGAGMNCRAL